MALSLARATPFHYTHVALYSGAAGWFATFHPSLQHSRRSTPVAWRMHPRLIVAAIETEGRLTVGARYGARPAMR
jgi:hypothetical protein